MGLHSNPEHHRAASLYSLSPLIVTLLRPSYVLRQRIDSSEWMDIEDIVIDVCNQNDCVCACLHVSTSGFRMMLFLKSPGLYSK